MGTPEIIDVCEAKTRLSELLDEVEAGGSVVIARAGRPVARLIPFHSRRRPPRVPGLMRGQIHFVGDQEAADQECARDFELAADNR